MVTQGVFARYDERCGRSLEQVVRWVCGLEGESVRDVGAATRRALAGERAGEVAGAAVRAMAGEGGDEVLRQVFGRDGGRWVREGLAGRAGREAREFACRVVRLTREAAAVAAALRALEEWPEEFVEALFVVVREGVRGGDDDDDHGDGCDHGVDGGVDGCGQGHGDVGDGHSGDGDDHGDVGVGHGDGCDHGVDGCGGHGHGDVGDGHSGDGDDHGDVGVGHSHGHDHDCDHGVDGYGHGHGDVGDGHSDDGDDHGDVGVGHSHGHSGHGCVKDDDGHHNSHSDDGHHDDGHHGPITNPVNYHYDTHTIDSLADLPAIAPLTRLLHAQSLPPTQRTLWLRANLPRDFPPLPLCAGNLPVVVLVRFILEFLPDYVADFETILPAIPANEQQLPDFARNQPFFRLCREYPYLPFFLQQCDSRGSFIVDCFVLRRPLLPRFPTESRNGRYFPSKKKRPTKRRFGGCQTC